jgi:putative redox protein
MTNASITWIEDMQISAQSDSGHAILMDAEEDGGGHDLAARPMEVLLMGVLGCTAMDVVGVLKKKRQPLRSFRIFATGERAVEHPRYYTKIHLEYVAYGDVEPEVLARAVQLSEEKYCGALATVRGSAQLSSSSRVEKAA